MAIPIANPKVQNLAIKAELAAAVDEVLESCHFILGENVTLLEQEIARYCAASHGVAVNSGTDALVIALAANGIGPGDEVITTPFTFVATAEAIMIVGAKPVFADIDPKTFNLDPNCIADKITTKTRAILPVHLYGQCADTDAIDSIARTHGLKVIYDGAQAIGSKRHGKGIGEFGDAATLSFFPTKNLGGCGDGGMVLANSDEVAAAAKMYRFHGMDATYSYEKVGYCSRLDEIQAALLRVKLKYIDAWNAGRRANAAYYIEKMSDLPIQLPIPDPENFHIYHQFTLRFGKRDQLKAKLAELGVGSGVYYPSPLHVQKAYANLGYKQGDFPESEKAALECLSLPVFPELPPDDRNTVAEAVVQSVKEL